MKHNPNDKCGLCDRLLGDSLIEWHHLVPKTFGGKELMPIHKICHRKIHSTFTERELKNYYFSFSHIKESEDIQKFIKWVSKKDLSFYDKSDFSNSRKRK